MKKLHFVGAPLVIAVVLATGIAPAVAATTPTASIRSATATLPASMSANLPIVRLHFNGGVSATKLPKLRTSPSLTTSWQQIGPNDVQAVTSSTLNPLVTYEVFVPTSVRCTARCVATTQTTHVLSVAASITWQEQLLAQLNYLPVTFSPSTAVGDPTQSVPGLFTWAYPNLPTSLQSQWRVGAVNVILRGATMAFQSTHQLPTTGVADASTWQALLNAVNAHDVNSSPYNYVSVSMAQPETLTLYSGNKTVFHTLVNTGISVAPTSTGTYPVYQRYITQTMSGTNPDGTHYSDPGIPWVSYFNGGDALHGFIRSTYGWPQSLGCVEMPFAAAKTVFPYTPIGTLVSVH